MNFCRRIKWRGMVHTMMPGTEELFEKGIVTAYLGIDPQPIRFTSATYAAL